MIFAIGNYLGPYIRQPQAPLCNGKGPYIKAFGLQFKSKASALKPRPHHFVSGQSAYTFAAGNSKWFGVEGFRVEVFRVIVLLE